MTVKTTQTARSVLIASALSGAFLAVALSSTLARSVPFDSASWDAAAETIWMAVVSTYVLPQKKRALLPVPTDEELASAHFEYDYNRSTEENYRSLDGLNYGQFAEIRNHLDGRFHQRYTRSRQFFQDRLIESLLRDTWLADAHGHHCSRPEQPWIVFTAGAMGAGKSHTVKSLDAENRFPLHSFVIVDPDQIRHRLPEFDGYVESNPLTAGEMTRKECGMMAEILTKAALQRGQNVLVDGTLRDADWYQSYFAELRALSPRLRIAIFHITAPRDAVFERALSRSKSTGRVVPRPLLEEVMQQVPDSIERLQSSVDFCVEIHNPVDNHVEIKTPGMDWERFQQYWAQVCA